MKALLASFFAIADRVDVADLAAIRSATGAPCPPGCRWVVVGTRAELEAAGSSYETAPGELMLDLGDRWVRAVVDDGGDS